MNTTKVGDKFEKRAYEFLLKEFDEVIWVSNKKRKSPHDFKCIKGKNVYFGDAKFLSNERAKPKLSKNQKNLDFIITNKNGGIIIIDKSNFKNNVIVEGDNRSEDKIEKLCRFIEEMKIGDEAKITNIAKKIGVHVNSVKGAIIGYEKVRNTGKLDIIRNKDDKIKRIVRVKDNSNDIFFKKELRDGITNINNGIDEMKEDIKELKKEKIKK